MSRDILSWLGFGRAPVAPAGLPQSVEMFMQGYSIPQISAYQMPGTGGLALLHKQRVIEAELRQYIVGLEQELVAITDIIVSRK